MSESKRPLREEELKEKFRQYFVKLSRKHDLDKSMENILWLHLKAVKCNQPEKFADGIKNFGLKL